jgi:hypothetical protein
MVENEPDHRQDKGSQPDTENHHRIRDQQSRYQIHEYRMIALPKRQADRQHVHPINTVLGRRSYLKHFDQFCKTNDASAIIVVPCISHAILERVKVAGQRQYYVPLEKERDLFTIERSNLQ